MAKQLFDISKTYIGAESKNKPTYEQDLTWEEAVQSLDGMESSWRRNGGTVLSRTESDLTVEDDFNQQVIEFRIVE